MSCRLSEGTRRPTSTTRAPACGACWAALGRDPSVTEMAPEPVIGVSSRDPRDQREWLLALKSSELVTRRNAPTARRLMTLARTLAYRADWETFESWPTWDRLITATGWSRSSVAAWLFELRLYGWLILLEPGTTPETTPMSLRVEGQGNTAAVYGMRVPQNPASATESAPQDRVAEDKTWTPSWSFNHDQETWLGGSSRARRIFHSSRQLPASEQEMEALRARFDHKQVMDFGVRVPTTEGQMLAAAAQLRGQHAVLARLTPKAVRAECRVYWRAGWTNAHVLHALIYRPTSTNTLPAMPAERVVAPARWIASRLGAWRDRRGQVLAPMLGDRAQVASRITARHGRAALRALPSAARVLTPADVRAFARSRAAEAAAQVARNQRVDDLERKARENRGPVATAEQKNAALALWRGARTHLVDEARARYPNPSTTAPTPASPTDMPPAITPAQRHERARARAQAERTARKRAAHRVNPPRM